MLLFLTFGKYNPLLLLLFFFAVLFLYPRGCEYYRRGSKKKLKAKSGVTRGLENCFIEIKRLYSMLLLSLLLLKLLLYL